MRLATHGSVRGQPAAIKHPLSDNHIDSFLVQLAELKILLYIHGEQLAYEAEVEHGGGRPHPNIVRFIGADTS